MSTSTSSFYAALRCLLIPAVLYLSSATVAMAQNLADFALGGHNICVVDTDGNLECTTRFEPEIYLPPDDGTLYSSVSSGDAHSCAITQSGELRCWGMNNFGQLDAPTSAVDFVSVETSEVHSCAIDANMQAFCWGLNTNGQTNVPEPNTGFVSLELSAIVSCGTKESGETVCWSSVENVTNNIPENPAYTDLAIGEGADPSQACGVTEDGLIDCWFSNQFAVDLPTGGPYALIESNGVIFCALTTAGLLDCTARTFSNSTEFETRVAALLDGVSAFPPLVDFEISRRAFPSPNICGLTIEGELVCAGDNLPANALPGQANASVDVPQITNLRFTAYSDTTVELFWDNPSNRFFAGSNIYRDNEFLAFTTNRSSYIDDTLVADQDFVYTVTLVDLAGFEGPMSEPLLASTSNRGQTDTGNNVNSSLSHPGQPTNLSITRYGDNSLEIFWDRPSGFFNPSFQVYRNGEFLAFAPGPSYFDDTVNPDTAYHYTIVVVEFRGDNVIGVGFVNEPALVQ